MRRTSLSPALLIAILCDATPSHAWTAIPIATEVAPSHYTAVYDPATDGILAFGGQPGSYDGVDLLHLGPNASWSIVRAARGPSARTDHASVLDPVRHRLLVIGGGGLADVWALSLDATPTWTLLAPGGSAPGGWSGHSAIYDPVRDRVLVFGGSRPGTSYSTEVWELDLAPALEWHQIIAGGGSPAPRREQTAIYDPVRDRMIVYGGSSGSGALGDAWALSLADPPVWNAITTTGPVPSPRSGHVAAYDPVRDRMVIGSGRSGSVWMNDFWSLALGPTPSWSDVLPPGSSSPLGRTQAALCYDQARDRFVYFGGQDSLGVRHDVWTAPLVSSADWQALLSDWGTGPTGSYASIATDPRSLRVFVLCGNDLWTAGLADPSPAWTRLAPAGLAPLARSQASMIFDSRRNRLVVFGGSPGPMNDTWSLALDPGGTWAPMNPSGTLPAPRSQCAAVYDSLRDRMIVFGGDGGPSPTTGNRYTWGDMFGLDLSGTPTWFALPGGPPARLDPGVSIDTGQHRMTMFGGGVNGPRWGPLTALGDLWQFHLGTDSWLSIPTVTGSPSNRWGSILAADPGLDEVAVIGGASFNTPLKDGSTYRYDGGIWSSLPDLPANLLRGIGMVDAGTHRVTVVSGLWSNSQFAPPIVAYTDLLPPRPTLQLAAPDSQAWVRGTVQSLSFPVTTSAPGSQIADYVASCDRAWPGFPFSGFVPLTGSAEITIGVPVPDTAATHVTIHLVARLRSDPAAADSADVALIDPSEIPSPILSLESVAPDTIDVLPGNAANISPLARVNTFDPQVVDYMAECDRNWGGVPMAGSVALQYAAYLPVVVSIPDTSVSDLGRVHITARLRAVPGATDSMDVYLRVVRQAAQAVLIRSSVSLTEIELTWVVSDATSPFWIERRGADGVWTALERVPPQPDRTIFYRDRNVEPGDSYQYGLSERDPGGTLLAVIRIDVPQPEFALHAAFPNPVTNDLSLSVQLLGGVPAQVDLIDIAGRRVRSLRVLDPAPGDQVIHFAPNAALPAGWYVVRISQGGRTASTRITVVH